jgi:hypothetical protein
MIDLPMETVTDLLEFLGYYGDSLPYKERVIVDAFKTMGGVIYGENKKNVSKKSFIVFLNAINNVFLQWMKGVDDESNSDFKLKSE